MGTNCTCAHREDVIQAGYHAQLSSQAAAVEAACAEDTSPSALTSMQDMSHAVSQPTQPATHSMQAANVSYLHAQPLTAAPTTTLLSLAAAKQFSLASCATDEEQDLQQQHEALRPLLSSSTFTSSSSEDEGPDSPCAPCSPMHQKLHGGTSTFDFAPVAASGIAYSHGMACSSSTPAMSGSSSQAAAFKFRPGSNPAVSFYRHTTEPLPHWWRPAAVYAAFEFMAWMVGGSVGGCWVSFLYSQATKALPL